MYQSGAINTSRAVGVCALLKATCKFSDEPLANKRCLGLECVVFAYKATGSCSLRPAFTASKTVAGFASTMMGLCAVFTHLLQKHPCWPKNQARWKHHTCLHGFQNRSGNGGDGPHLQTLWSQGSSVPVAKRALGSKYFEQGDGTMLFS